MPYPTTGPQLRQLLNRFGSRCVVWGSDFPLVSKQCGGARGRRRGRAGTTHVLLYSNTAFAGSIIQILNYQTSKSTHHAATQG
jgi:hypothetical protein